MLGKPVPDFSLPATGGSTFRPQANTPGCTQQGSEFRDHYKEFGRANCRIHGISRDSLESHEGFKA